MLLVNLNRKEQLRHHVVSLRQHGFLVYIYDEYLSLESLSTLVVLNKQKEITKDTSSSDEDAAVRQLVYAVVFYGHFTSHFDEVSYRQRVRLVICHRHTHTQHTYIKF